MDEALTFWLDNKICSGFKVAEIDQQILASYRDKYYIVVKGAALMKGVRPLHYSKTSLPLIWKKALKGILPPPAMTVEQIEDDFLPITTSTKKERIAMKKTADFVSETAGKCTQPLTVTQPAKKSAPIKVSEAKPVKIVPTHISATCPYCNCKQELAFEKGKNGKPFFTMCVKCSVDFAVRFVPVTVYQAQVAAFK